MGMEYRILSREEFMAAMGQFIHEITHGDARSDGAHKMALHDALLRERVEEVEEVLEDMYEACLNGLGPNTEMMDRVRTTLDSDTPIT